MDIVNWHKNANAFENVSKTDRFRFRYANLAVIDLSFKHKTRINKFAVCVVFFNYMAMSQKDWKQTNSGI